MSNCPKCGSVCKPGEKFCMQCGYSFPAQPAPMPVQGGGQMYGQVNMPVKPAKKKFPIVPVIILAVLAVILVVGGIIGFKYYKANSGYNKLVKQFMQSIQEEDEDLFIEIQNDYLPNVLEAEKDVNDKTGMLSGVDYIDDFNEFVFEKMMEEIEDEVGDIEEFEYEIKKVNEKPKSSMYEDAFADDIEDLNEEIEYYEDYYDDDEIDSMKDCIETIESFEDIIKESKAAVKIDIKVNIKGDDGKYKGEFPIIAVNDGGTWTMIPCAWEWFK